MSIRPRFAIIGAAGFVARRHLAAIRDIGGDLVAAMDPSDSVGQLDEFSPNAAFFTAFEPFLSFLHAEQRKGTPIDYVSICSPNDLHFSHAEAALRAGCNVICEKPLTLDPTNIDSLDATARALQLRVHPILQLRLNPANIALKRSLAIPSPHPRQIDLTYVTVRGPWYHASWKGDDRRSGGIAANIGVHFFDLLCFLLGTPISNELHFRASDRAAGQLTFAGASVRWLLSLNPADLPPGSTGATAHRHLVIDGRSHDLSGDFRNLHTACYREALAGRSVDLMDARRAIAIVADLRATTPEPAFVQSHSLLDKSVHSDRGRRVHAN